MKQLLTKENFKCSRYCGNCCKKLSVELSKEEIKKIKKLGYKEGEFLDKNLINMNKLFLKNENGCVFLKKDKNKKYYCRIYKNRPKICRQYPFFRKAKIKSCLPKELYPNAFFPLKLHNQ